MSLQITSQLTSIPPRIRSESTVPFQFVLSVPFRSGTLVFAPPRLPGWDQHFTALKIAVATQYLKWAQDRASEGSYASFLAANLSLRCAALRGETNNRHDRMVRSCAIMGAIALRSCGTSLWSFQRFRDPAARVLAFLYVFCLPTTARCQDNGQELPVITCSMDRSGILGVTEEKFCFKQAGAAEPERCPEREGTGWTVGGGGSGRVWKLFGDGR